MRRKLLYLFAVLLIISGCDTTKDQPVPEQFQTYYLQKQTANYVWANGSTGTIEQVYSYNDQNQLVSIDATTYSRTETLHQTFSYLENDKVVHIQSTPKTSWSNTYNEKEQLVKQVRNFVSEDGSVEVHYYKNFYNEAGELVEAQIRNVKNNIDELGTTFKYTYAGGEVTSILGELPNGEKSYHHFYTYDDKRAPLPAYLPQLIGMKYSAFQLPGRLLSDHNITSYTVLEGDGKRKKSYCFEAAYVYNGAGYPTESTKKFEDGTVEKTTYTYMVK